MDEQKPPSDAELSGDGPLPVQPLCPVCRSRPLRTTVGTCFYEVCMALGNLREAIRTREKRGEFRTGFHTAFRELIGKDGDGGDMTISRPCVIDGLDGMAA